jgi:hypothetical protein
MQHRCRPPSRRLPGWVILYLPGRAAALVQAWLGRPGYRVKLHFIQTYCPHLDPTERLW